MKIKFGKLMEIARTLGKPAMSVTKKDVEDYLRKESTVVSKEVGNE